MWEKASLSESFSLLEVEIESVNTKTRKGIMYHFRIKIRSIYIFKTEAWSKISNPFLRCDSIPISLQFLLLLLYIRSHRSWDFSSGHALDWRRDCSHLVWKWWLSWSCSLIRFVPEWKEKIRKGWSEKRWEGVSEKRDSRSPTKKAFWS